ncbi:ECF RNA polymerase sigma factor SigR [Nonomuraea coxensis DSM 45129]|uniref:ECF RNA polymerase sigma factor SigR n=1 Tax=Nonomuraea coxensis DSM 45129 TaxID=1122611 RepID=A0ABX8U311_9ACTN|nr:RNA polymerase sigma factor [Nonomuraea coxensis]QYC41963.1 ECF RNA polymerase sigma factor SigR [Nonomuraea coxensis DSM 45129]
MDDERRAKFEAAYHQAYGLITAYAARRCDSPQDAADVVAETFTVAWRRVAELPDGAEATPWLYGVARKVLANHFRGDNRRRARTAELDAEMADLYGHSPDTEVELDAIGRAFRSLPEEDRELLSLVAWEGLGREEIATALGLSRNAVRIRLHRARRRLARALARSGERADERPGAGTPLVPSERSL